jgi:hypothetical protein
VLQDQAYMRALAVDFFVSLLTTVDGWAERTLAEIKGWKDLSPDGKNDRGLEISRSFRRRLPVSTPIAHRCRLEPSDGGGRRGQGAQSDGGHENVVLRPCPRSDHSHVSNPDVAFVRRNLRKATCAVTPAPAWTPSQSTDVPAASLEQLSPRISPSAD